MRRISFENVPSSTNKMEIFRILRQPLLVSLNRFERPYFRRMLVKAFSTLHVWLYDVTMLALHSLYGRPNVVVHQNTHHLNSKKMIQIGMALVIMHPSHWNLFAIFKNNFFFAGDIGNYYYGQGHPMKPHRIRMTHNLLLNYGLYRKMEIYVNNFSFEKNFFFQMSVTFLIGFVQICSVHIKPPRMKWPNSIQMIIFDSFDPFGQTTCPNITSRCSDVSKIYTNLSSCCVWWSFLTHFFGFSIFFCNVQSMSVKIVQYSMACMNFVSYRLVVL